VAFQGDPFHTGITRDFVGVSGEASSCSRKQRKCASRLAGGSIRRWWKRTKCKNSGVWIGGANQLMIVLEEYVKYLHMKRHRITENCHFINQVIFNLIIGQGIVQKRGARVVVWKEASAYRALDMVWRRRNVTYLLGHYRLFENGVYPLVLHMFDRSKRFCNSAIRACPAQFYSRDEHLRCKLYTE
jgi:hypothetical protein